MLIRGLLWLLVVFRVMSFLFLLILFPYFSSGPHTKYLRSYNFSQELLGHGYLKLYFAREGTEVYRKFHLGGVSFRFVQRSCFTFFPFIPKLPCLSLSTPFSFSTALLKLPLRDEHLCIYVLSKSSFLSQLHR